MQFSVYQIRAIIQGISSFGPACAIFSLPSTVTIIQRMLSSTARAVVRLSDTGNHPRDMLFQHRLCSIQSTEYGYNHPRDAFSYCSCESIRYGQLSKGYALPTLLMQSSVYQVRLYQTRAIIQRMHSSGTAYVVRSLPSTVISDTDNHPRDALFRHRLCSFQATKYGYNYSRDASFYCPCSYRPSRYGQSS